MSEARFELNEQTLSVIHELGDHMPGGFFICRADASGAVIYANLAGLRLYGCETAAQFSALTGDTFEGMVCPEDYPRVLDALAHRREDGAEYRIVRRDGQTRWAVNHAHYVDTDRYGGVYTMFISDVTETHERIASDIAGHRAAIEELSQSFRRMDAERITFNRVAQALARDYFSIYIVDPDTEHFVEYSATPESDRMGVEKEGDDFFTVSRRNMDRLIYPEDRDRFMAVFTRERVLSILKRDGSFTTKYRLMVDGEPTYVSMKATLMEDAQGRHLIIGTNNINAQMTREEEYRRKVADARTQAKNDFLANMSHDIRTPMNAIVGYTNIANSHLDDPAVVRDSLAKIGSSSHFLLSLINDVLDISKIESGKMQLNIGDCDLSAVLRRIEDITSLQAERKSLRITYRHEGIRHSLVRGDELRIEQILINIISNAIKYTPEGKTVALTAEETGPLGDGRTGYRFTVQDTGIGISPDYLPYLFDSFTREQSTRINKIQGTGLGLAITARVVEQMGGQIAVESELGRGSTFTVTLPMETLDRETGGAQAAPVADIARLHGRRVLLVEDNDINAEIATIILHEYGIAVTRAENGRVGLDTVRDQGPGYFDAVLMDLQMPEMDGYEAARAIRALPDPAFRALPIIAMSANAYDEDVRACLAAGMNAHIAKPFQPADLAARLAALL